MAKTAFTSWIMAARLRTLPLSISGIIAGASLGLQDTASPYSILESAIFWLAIATTLGLQILSNFANDYGDGVKGTDNEQRIGPKRAIQSGLISEKTMRRGLIVTAVITLVVAVALIYVAFGESNFLYSLLFFILGVAAIVAAIKYTVGNSAYGYKGLGDVFVFIFFGIVSVMGCYFLFNNELNFRSLLIAISIGSLSTAVLNLNNLRDIEGDKKAGKNTLVVKLGWKKAKRYHILLGVIAFLSYISYLLISFKTGIDMLPLLAFVIVTPHFIKVNHTENPMLLDPELKKVALSTFFFSVLLALSIAL